MPLMDALPNSVNTIFPQVALSVGPDAVAETARRMGVRSPLDPVCSITLGTQTVTPLDMATGYSTVAAGGGRHRPPGGLTRKSSSGQPIDPPREPGERGPASTSRALQTPPPPGAV